MRAAARARAGLAEMPGVFMRMATVRGRIGSDSEIVRMGADMQSATALEQLLGLILELDIGEKAVEGRGGGLGEIFRAAKAYRGSARSRKKKRYECAKRVGALARERGGDPALPEFATTLLNAAFDLSCPSSIPGWRRRTAPPGSCCAGRPSCARYPARCARSGAPWPCPSRCRA